MKSATICEITIQTARTAEIIQSRRLGNEEDAVMPVNQYVGLLHEEANCNERLLIGYSAPL